MEENTRLSEGNTEKICRLLHRSIDIADLLKLDAVALVVGQAIYAEAQGIGVPAMDYPRLGAFHITAMTFLTCIGTQFRDAGLEVIQVLLNLRCLLMARSMAS